jgi:AraC-like DNA-binding protein
MILDEETRAYGATYQHRRRRLQKARGPMTEMTVAAGYARALLDLAVSRGAGREELLRRCGIVAADLQRQDNRLPLPRYVAMMRAAQELCHDPALALHFGESVDCSEVSLLPNVGPRIANMQEGMAELNRYARLDLDIGTSDRFQLLRTNGELWLVDNRPDDYPEITESFLARVVCSLRRWCPGAEFVRAIQVTHPAPAHHAEYERIFRVPVQFGSDKTAILFSPEFWAAVPPAVTSRYACGVVSAHADSLLENLDRAQSMRGRVETLLRILLPAGNASIATVARQLGVSRSTLFRRLKVEGVTFEKVLDDLRHEMALDYLNTRKASVHETAYRLGFADPGAFYRAYRRWTGTSLRSNGRARVS